MNYLFLQLESFLLDASDLGLNFGTTNHHFLYSYLRNLYNQYFNNNNKYSFHKLLITIQGIYCSKQQA